MTETSNKMSGKNIAILAAVLVVLIAAIAVIYVMFGPKATQGAKAVTIEVVDDQGETTSFEVHTDAEFLQQAMDELAESNQDFSYEGTESDMGTMVNTVCGLTADYDTDAAYWALYVDGAYGSYGISAQPVDDGAVYTLTYTMD